ncbi:hypothetical protein JKY72_06795 [Candidatus Gracilibacteria bacterium]|nr:hypothetical protein [Candidatus Gracilibacteria bacterium]
MKKLLGISLSFVILLAGCSGGNDAYVEDKLATPLQAIIAENLLLIENSDTYPLNTELHIERMLPENPKDLPWLKVVIIQDGLPDDSIKREESELHLKRQQDGLWEVTYSELLDFECYREKSKQGCI